VIDPVKADVVVMNTCSVRQKGEDRVFGFMREISRYHKTTSPQSSPEGEGVSKQVLFGITGCMVRKSGLAKRYLVDEGGVFQDEEYKRN
jgi:tRNA A37 methylthiotransferase MiaB